MNKRVDEFMKSLREYYKMGQVKQLAPKKMNKAEVLMMNKFTTLNPDTQRKVANFADIKRGYSTDELENLIVLCKRHQYALGFALIARLLSVPKADRQSLQKMMAESQWSRRDLDLWIQANYGSRT